MPWHRKLRNSLQPFSLRIVIFYLLIPVLRFFGNLFEYTHHAFETFSDGTILLIAQTSVVPVNTLCAHSPHLIYETDRVGAETSRPRRVMWIEGRGLLRPTVPFVTRHGGEKENRETRRPQAFRQPHYHGRSGAFLLATLGVVPGEFG